MTNDGAKRYGNFYWCVKTDQATDGEVYAFADRVEVTAGGDLILWRVKDDGEIQNMSFAKGHWSAFYAASILDGHACAAQYWAGELA